jgi:hypothetical protein
MPVKSSGVLFERAAKKLGLHPFPAPVAILSEPYQGRAACVNCGFQTVALIRKAPVVARV